MLFLSWPIDLLRPWDVFIASYLAWRFIIWFVADYLKVRWLRPLNEARAKRSPTQRLVSKEQTDTLEDYRKVNYQRFPEIAKDLNRIDSMSDESFESFALNYVYRVQKRIIHIHHFILGIPLIPLTWILYFYHFIRGPSFSPVVPWGMLFAGATFALFMSEFYQLLTQEWGP